MNFPRRWGACLFLTLWLVGSHELAAQNAPACDAPAPVCAARATVFAISSYDPLASAVRIGPNLLVTNRHVVADETRAEVILPDGRRVAAKVVPSAYPGDLVLLRAADLDPGPILAPAGEAVTESALYTLGADAGNGMVRAYAPGNLLLAPAPGKALARLHHSAESYPGNSGGALVDEAGRLVGITASGGEGRNDAIPASEIARLRGASGPDHIGESRRIGAAYRACGNELDHARGRLSEAQVENLRRACMESGNRQLLDLAAQALGRAGRLEASLALFELALAQDPHAINARIGLVVTLQLARRYAEATPHLARLLDIVPADLQIQRLAVLSGKWGGEPALAERAYGLIETHHPLMAPSARKFLDSAAEPPRPPANPG